MADLTKGQKRVRVSFNPSALKRVEDFKAIMASAIDLLEDIRNEVSNAPVPVEQMSLDIGDFHREVSTAQTELQMSSMMGVASLTHEVAFKLLPSTTNE